jgi:hypothetical protein
MYILVSIISSILFVGLFGAAFIGAALIVKDKQEAWEERNSPK